MKNTLIFILVIISNIAFAQIISRDSVGTGATAVLGGTELDPTVLSSVKDGVDYSEVTNTPNTITNTQSNAITTNSNHAIRTDNPHSVTAAQVGLGNVDNTSDVNKPISTATQTALDSKQNTLTFDSAPTNSSTNPVTSGGVFTAINNITPTTVENVLTSTSTTNALSAAQGKALKDALDAEISSTNSEQAAQDAAIALNNAKVSADGSVTSHSDVTNAGSGQIITTAERTILGEAVQTLTWNDAPNQLIISDGNAVILSGFANATHTHDIGDITGVTTEFIMAGTFNPATAGTNAAIPNKRLFWGTDGALYSKGGAGTITQIGAN